MHKFRGGIRIGNSFHDALNYTWPFAEADFTESGLQLSIFFFRTTTWLLPYNDISGVSLKKVFFQRGIIIRHHSAQLPEFLLFWTRKDQPFLEECRNHAIPVAD